MQLLLLLAGLGTRLRPFTFTTPKCLIRLAGKPVLGHLLDYILGQLSVDQVIAVCSERDRNAIERYVRQNYSLPFEALVQPSPRGQADAVRVAGSSLRGPVLIAFGDTIVRANLAELTRSPADVAILAHLADDPSAHGSLILSGDEVIGIEEKRRSTEPAPVAAGLYFVRNTYSLLKCADVAVRQADRTGSEAYLAETFREMIAAGSHIRAQLAEAWEDCGDPSALLKAHRHLLLPCSGVSSPSLDVHPPIYTGPDTIIQTSDIGPYLSIERGSRIVGSSLRDSIIGEGTTIENSSLINSIVGSHCHISGLRGGDGLLLGDYCRITGDEPVIF